MECLKIGLAVAVAAVMLLATLAVATLVIVRVLQYMQVI